VVFLARVFLATGAFLAADFFAATLDTGAMAGAALFLAAGLRPRLFFAATAGVADAAEAAGVARSGAFDSGA
jgi:hypothetical protein